MGGKTTTGRSERTSSGRKAIVPATLFRETAVKNNEIEEFGVKFKTGEPVTFNFVRNTTKAPHLPGDEFQQSLEPAGRYMLHDFEPEREPPKGWEKGTVAFQRPLVIELNSNPDAMGAYDETSWKANLSKQYGGKTGAKLSRALQAAGYDGIVTIEKGGKTPGTREIIDIGIVGKNDRQKLTNFLSSDDAPHMLPVGHAHDIRTPMPGKPIVRAPQPPRKKKKKGPA